MKFLLFRWQDLNIRTKECASIPFLYEVLVKIVLFRVKKKNQSTRGPFSHHLECSLFAGRLRTMGKLRKQQLQKN